MFTKTVRVAAVLLTLSSTAALAAPAFDANIEMDTDYRNAGRGAAQGGRVELNVMSKTGTDGFVAGRTSLLATKAASVNGSFSSAVVVDDMWVQFGNAAGDIKLGRFEGVDLFPTGKDTVVDHDGIFGYRNVLRGRYAAYGTIGGVAQGVAHGALTINAAPGLSVELGVVAGGKNTGVRPVISYVNSGFTAKLGVETGKTPFGAKVEGIGATVGTTFSGTAVNVSIGNGKVGGIKASSIGVNATSGPAGAGFIMDKTNGVKENNFYASYSLPLFSTGATITPAIAYSKASSNTSDGNITARLRINYGF